MPPKPSQTLDWKTVQLKDIKKLTRSQLKELSEARKRDTRLAQPESSPHLPEAAAAQEAGPSGSSVDAAGPVRTTRQSSKRLTPYAREERNPKSLDVKRYQRKGQQAPPQTKKSINAPSPASSPEPEEEDDRHVDAPEESVELTIDMMCEMQRQNEELEKENADTLRQTEELRAIAKELQHRLVAERSRTDRILTYIKNWQQTSEDWTFDAIFPKRDAILMTKSSEDAGVTETTEVDCEDAEKIPALKRFLDESIETPGNLTESMLKSTPPNNITDLGDRVREAEPESGANEWKGKGKAKDVSFHPEVDQPSRQESRKRPRGEETALEALAVQILRVASEKSKAKHANESRHFTNLEASGSGSSRVSPAEEPTSSEPAPKRQNLGRQGLKRTQSVVFPTKNKNVQPTDIIELVYGANRGSADPEEKEKGDSTSFTWNKYGRPVINILEQGSVPIQDHVSNIRRAVQFIQAGPPPGFVAEEEGRTVPRHTEYRRFVWNADGTPDVDIPDSLDSGQVDRLFRAVKFLGTWRPWPHYDPPAGEKESAPAPLEHEDSERTLSVDGLRCSWTSSGLPVVTFTTEANDDPQYIGNILLASAFILRGPGPDDKWEEEDKLPDRFRGHLPTDPKVVCTLNHGRQIHITLPPPTSPCYYDRIVISAQFIRAERELQKQRLEAAEALARNKAEDLARQIDEDDDDVLNASVNLGVRASIVYQKLAQERVEENIEEESGSGEDNITENAADGNVEESIQANAGEGDTDTEDQADEKAEEQVVVKQNRKTNRKPGRKATKKGGRKSPFS